MAQHDRAGQSKGEMGLGPWDGWWDRRWHLYSVKRDIFLE